MKRTSSVSEWLVRTTSRMRRSVARAGVGSGYNVLESGEVRPRPAFARPIAELSLPFPRAVLILSMVFLSIIAFRLMRAPISLLALPTRIVEVPVPVEYRPSIRDLISRSSQEYGLPEVIVRGVAGIESQWNAQSTRYESRHAKRAAALHPNDATAQRLAASSIGIMQVMGWQLGKEHPGKLFEVEYNIQQGTRILAECRSRAHSKLGDGAKEDAAFWAEVLGCYNGDRVSYPDKVFAEIGKQLFADPLE